MPRICTLFLVVICLCAASCVSKKPKILIIGDSISMGYTPYVKNQLRKKARVYHNSGNAQHTTKGLKNIEHWVTKEKWEIIQFNWGLWDICYRDNKRKYPDNKDKINGIITTSKLEYANNLDSIVSLIQNSTQAQLIFVTTTFVPAENIGRYSNDVILYNDTAKTIMNKHEVIVNDIYQKSKSIHDQFSFKEDDVHFSSTGYKMIGAHVSATLEKLLAKTSPSDSIK
ncbi:MAG: hypothetical protein ACJAZ2_001626 [Glaciecola sp.]|jgi:hypothetical protein